MRMIENIITPTPINGELDHSAPSIIDRFGRSFNYLRLALNEQCNLRCIYCMPEEGIDFRSKDKLLTTEEIFKLIDLTSKMGVSKIRFTGGEPLLQLDKKLINFLKSFNFEIGIETNGTMDLPCKIDWVCVSPKDENNFVLKKGDELKLIFPQKKVNPKSLENLKFKYFFLQPMDGPNLKSNIKKTYAFCDKNKKWNVSLQLHKIAGIP